MSDTLSERVRDRIRLEMDRKGISQRDVAGMLETYQSKVSKILNGKQQMGVDDMEQLCFVLDLSPTEAVRDQGLEFVAEMQPYELRLLERIRKMPPEELKGLFQILHIKLHGFAPDRHAGPLKGDGYRTKHLRKLKEDVPS